MKLLLVMVIAGLIGAWAGYTFMYNKKHTNYEKMEPAYVISAEQLFNEFRDNAAVASDKYTGEVIEISGSLSGIEMADSLEIVVFAFSEGMFGDEGVRVTMLPAYSETIRNLTKSKAVTLKGFCSGYNGTDVILESGSLPN